MAETSNDAAQALLDEIEGSPEHVGEGEAWRVAEAEASDQASDATSYNPVVDDFSDDMPPLCDAEGGGEVPSPENVEEPVPVGYVGTSGSSSSDDESSEIWARRELKPTHSVDSEETLILGGSRPEELAAVLPELVDGFNARLDQILNHPPPCLPPGKIVAS